MAAIVVEGNCDPKFERVKAAFIENFEQQNECGAAVAVTIDGRPVVDLWGGHTDKARTHPWQRDTLVNVYSTTKGFTAVCANRLADQGLLDLDAPVVRYWPEFGKHGKDKIPVRWLLSHRAGLAAISRPLEAKDIYDWNTMAAALADQEPWWEPGTKHGYHAFTIGWLVGEVVRRITGKSLGTYFREEVVGPLDIDCHIGLDARDDVRCANLLASPPPPPGAVNVFAYAMEHPESVTGKAFMNPAALFSLREVHTRQWRGAEIPGANGHATARGLARLYGALARGGEIDGVRIMSAGAIERAATEQSYGTDEVLFVSTRFGLGFMLTQPTAPMGPSPRAFGHPGAGGSLGFADPNAKLGFGYTMNQMGPHILLDPRVRALTEAIYASL